MHHSTKVYPWDYTYEELVDMVLKSVSGDNVKVSGLRLTVQEQPDLLDCTTLADTHRVYIKMNTNYEFMITGNWLLDNLEGYIVQFRFNIVQDNVAEIMKRIDLYKLVFREENPKQVVFSLLLNDENDRNSYMLKNFFKDEDLSIYGVINVLQI